MPIGVRRLTLLSCSLLPITIVNTFFAWPKIISVGYLLIVFTLSLVWRARDAREQAIVGILLGGATTLAALCHGSSAFAILGMGVVVLLAWQWPSWRTLAYAIPTLVVLYLPWVAYQRFVDPPGNRLLKWHLAGVEEVDSRGFLETMRDVYSSLSWDSYIAGRLSNAAAMLGDPIQSLRDLAMVVFNQDFALAKEIRHGDFFNFIPSLHGYLLALILSIVLLPMIWTTWPHQRRIVLKLLGVVFITGVVCCIVLLKPASAINHQTTYALQVMVTIAAFIVIGTLEPIVGLLFIAAQIVTVGTVYGLTLPYDKGYWPMLALNIVATLGLFGYTLMPFVRLSLRER